MVELYLNHEKFKLQNLINLRHELHQYPEISWNEFETEKRLLNYLNKLENFKQFSKIHHASSKTGFWIDIFGKGPSKNHPKLIAFRTDTDALPLIDKTGKDYTSKNIGVSHSCGHDGHMAIMVGVIEFMLLILEKFPSDFGIRFLFQPAEEILLGAKHLIKEGCLQDISEVYGLHNICQDFNVGQIGCCEGPVTATGTSYLIEITGKGGHGSTPHLNINPILPMSMISIQLNQLNSQEINSKEISVLSIGSIQSGTVGNIIPDTALLKGTIRTCNSDTDLYLRKRIEEISNSVGESFKCTTKVSFPLHIGSCINSKELKNIVEDIASRYFSYTEKNLPLMASEDFSEYGKLVPSVIFILGGGDEKHFHSLHSPFYDFNDKIIPFGIEMYLRIAEERAK